MSAPTSEIGYAGGSENGWWAAAALETTPELMWPHDIAIYDRMVRQDSRVFSTLRAVTLPVMRTKWRVDPFGARDEVVETVAQDLGLPIRGAEDATPPRRTRGRFSWPEHLQHALLALRYGHMPFEQVYAIDPVTGLARLRKLAPRMPRTLSAINVADDGGLVSIEQWPSPTTPAHRLGLPTTIPVSRLVMYTNDREAGDWRGTSLLRSAYKHWVLKDRFLRLQAIAFERNGVGVPRYTGAPKETDLSKGEKLAQDWRSGSNAGAAIPYGAMLDLVGVSGAIPDADKPIRYHDEQISASVLAHFLNLGQASGTGSYALGASFMDFFTMSLQTVAENVADTANAHVVEDMVDVNFGEDEPAPRLVFDEIGSRHAATAEAIQILVAAGVLSPDMRLDRFVRESYGLPGADPATARDAPAEAPAASGTATPQQFGATSVVAP
ncbi:MAG: DUF935 family protein [Myxococcaceae bacterium]|nr:MAG: DUF935 family protein [Myxococcaceae bacterium]